MPKKALKGGSSRKNMVCKGGGGEGGNPPITLPTFLMF